jgi:nucleotide-binding universal stress UspA family protein
MEMTQEPGTAHGAVVVGVDGSEESLVALDWAVETAMLEGRHLHVVHALARHGNHQGAAIVDTARRRAGVLAPAIRVTAEFVEGTGTAALVAVSRSAAIVCVGAHGETGFRPRFLGSTALSVASAALCPVAVIREPPMGGERARRIVVGVDEAAGSHDAIGYAFAQADLRGVPLTAVHAWHSSDRLGLSGAVTPADRWQTLIGNEEAAMAECLAGWSEKYPDVEVSRVSIRRSSHGAILATAGDAVLIVLGSRQPRPQPDLVGSPTIRRVLQDAVCPVVVVPQTTH